MSFERHNAKYNRIWEQLTSIALFFIATFLAWSGLRYNLMTDLLWTTPVVNIIQRITLFNGLTILYSAILLLLAFSSGYLLSHLFRARDKIKEIFVNEKIRYS